jgi:serine/threonine-protein kinase
MLGDFHLLRCLGQGGMGQVYLAEQISLKRKVAIKIMRSEVALEATSFQRFRAEAEAIARITHANIVQVYAFGQEGGLHYMALEYVEGRNLREYLAKKGTVDVHLAVSFMRQVASALQRASELGIIHRDIKPENILLTRRGEVKVADFGLSRCFGEQPSAHLTQTGVTMGTPLYMSPEQVQGKELDPRTDIYSFGVTCYHMLAGQPPFLGENALAIAMCHVRSEPPSLAGMRPDLPAELCAVVHKMMAKEPAMRYQSCSELLKDLLRVRDILAVQRTQAVSGTIAPGPMQVNTVPVATLPTPAAGILTLSPLQSRWLMAAAGIGLALALVIGGLMAWLRAPSSAAGPPQTKSGSEDLLLSDQAKQEKFLREAVTQYAAPHERGELELGLRHCVELGLFYLKRHRFEEADNLFMELVSRAQKPYQNLGRLGHAIVLARQDRAAESNQAFLELVSEMPRQGQVAGGQPWRFFIDQPLLRYEIGTALEFNKANAAPSEPFPRELDFLREPPRWPLPLTGGPRPKNEKAPGKGK